MSLPSRDVYVGILAFAVAVALSVVLTPAVIAAARRLQLFDNPDGARRVHRVPVPRVGGVAVFLAAAATLAIFAPGILLAERPYHVSGLAVGAAIMFVLGLVDDLRELPPIAKLLGQVAAAAAVVAISGYPERLAIVPGTEVHIGWVGAPLLFVWIIAVTNAYNLVDGLNGLASGIAVVACATGIVIGGILGSSSTIIAVALTGALIGFSRYNFPRASVFLGDSGTMSIGFLLAVLLVRTATTPSGAVLFLVPVFAVMVPFLDTGLAIVRRWLRKVPLSGADARHIHHRLLAMGLSSSETVVHLWLLAVLFTGFGLLVTLAPPVFAGLISAAGSAVFAVVVIYGTNILAYHELSVAREVLVEGPGRIRRVISEQIHAMDLCEAIGRAESMAEVNALLDRNAHVFGVSRIMLRSDLRDDAIPAILPGDERAGGSGGWRLDFHVSSAARGYQGTLSIWSDTHDGRVSGAERLARILAPALSSWLSGVRAPQGKASRRRRRGLATMMRMRRESTPVPAGAGEVDIVLNGSLVAERHTRELH